VRLALTLSLAALSLLACATAPSPSEQQSYWPSWYVQPQANTAKNLYGTAVATSREAAEKLALVNLLERVFVSLKSAQQQQRSSHKIYREYTESLTENQIISKTLKLELVQYQLTQLSVLPDRQIAVEVAIDKPAMIRRLQDKINTAVRLAEQQHKLALGQSTLKAWLTQTDIGKQLQLVTDEAILLELLNHDDNGFIEARNRQQMSLAQLQQALSFYIETDKASQHWQSLFKTALLAANLTLNDKQQSASATLKISANTSVKQTHDLYLASSQLELSLSDQNQQLIAQQPLLIKAVSANSQAEAISHLADALSKQLSKTSIADLLGLKQS
jgi:hypothetical protein